MDDEHEPRWVTLERRLALLEQAVESGFERLRLDLANYLEHLKNESARHSVEIESIEERVAKMEPWVNSFKWAVLLIGGSLILGVTGIATLQLAKAIVASGGLP